MYESQLWNCNICDKTIKLKNKSNHINSHSHKLKEKFSNLVKIYAINNPQINKDECIYGLNYMNTNSYRGNLSILLKENEYKYQLYGLHKKLRNIKTGSLVFLNIKKITVKI